MLSGRQRETASRDRPRCAAAHKDIEMARKARTELDAAEAAAKAGNLDAAELAVRRALVAAGLR
jgi:hypothetical protein